MLPAVGGRAAHGTSVQGAAARTPHRVAHGRKESPVFCEQMASSAEHFSGG